MINHYKILNVSENASEMQIKKAFRILALKLHPDKTKFQNSNEFLRIKDSYDILINKNKRRIYDTQLYKFRNPQPLYSDVDLGKLSETTYPKDNMVLKFLNFFIRITIVAIFITITTYSCDFINNNIFTSKKDFYNQNANLPENKAKSDSLITEDLKLEKALKNTEEKKPNNGEIKF